MNKLCKINGIRLLGGENGGVTLLIDIDRVNAQDCRTAVETANKGGKQYGIKIEPIRKQRSLDANAYFHLLVNKIAQASGVAEDKVKEDLVLNYGTLATDSNGDQFFVYLPKTVAVADYWKYAKFIGESGGCNQYVFYKETHTMNTAEMAKLIEGTINEAKQLGIDTDTPEEKARLQAILRGNEK